TCGSIRIPASHHSLAGLRSTHGLASLDGIIPLSGTQDVAGPLARTVRDLAIVLDATSGEDPADPATFWGAETPRPRFVAALDKDALRGARLGVLNGLFGDAPEDQEVGRIIRAAVSDMEKAGATAVDVLIPDLLRMLESSGVIDHEFKTDLSKYLARSPAAPVRSLGEILERGLYHSMLERTFRRRNSAPTRDSEEYRKATDRRRELQAAVRRLMERENLDALVYPAIRRQAAVIGEPQGGSTCQLSASTGFPALTVPAGFTEDGMPVGVELLGLPRNDARLVALGYSYEQATRHRRPPSRTPPLTSGRVPEPVTWETSAGGGEVVPPVATGANSKAWLTLDPSKALLTFRISLEGLEKEQVLFAAVHRGEPGENGPAVHLLSSKPFLKLEGSLELTEALRRDLISGRLYLIVATTAHRAGEVRAQLRPPA
ncbi:MAG: CHRD domain-containing protein, partial [Acidobacteria bacterium]|nr:CHRD domain-containing protein [Acidobacteriota bacterium]